MIIYDKILFMKNILTLLVFTIIQIMGICVIESNAQVANDAGITSIKTPACTSSLSIQLSNTGTNDINSVNIGWSVNGAYQTVNTHNQLLKSGDSINFTLSPSYNFVNGNTYSIKVFTYAPNNVTDGDKKNDTSKLTFKFYATAKNPSITDFVKCGLGKASLKAIPGNAEDSILWYNAATGGSVIAKGKNALSPSLSFGVDTFFAQAFKMGSTCPSSRVPLKITVKTSPYGAAFTKGTPFENPNPNTTGTQTDPDLVAAKGKLTYELSPPTGYNNSGYGTTWRTMSPVVKTSKGIVLDPKYWAYTAPSGSTPGKFTLSPDKDIEDTCLSVTLQIKDLGPYFCDSTISRYICVVPRPYSYFSFDDQKPNCQGDTVVFTNKSMISSGTLSSKWNFGTGNPADTANTKDAKFKFSPAGTYFVKLTTTSSNNIRDSISIPVVINESPNAEFNIGPPCNLTKTDFTFAGTKPSGNKTTFKWDFNGEGTSTVENPSNLFSDTGIKKITLTLTSNNGCKDSITKTVKVRPQAKADFTASDVCEDDSAVFVNKSIGADSYYWKFGDALNSSLQSPKHFFTINGATTTFNVTLSARVSNGCADSITKPITVNANPKSDFTASDVCETDSVIFINKSKGAQTYNWKFGDGNISYVESPKHFYFINGFSDTFNVTLIARGTNGCSDSTIETIKVNANPKSDFTYTISGHSMGFNANQAGNVLYKWFFGDGDSASTSLAFHKYSKSGRYNICLNTMSAVGCFSQTCKSVSLKCNAEFTKSVDTSQKFKIYLINNSSNTSTTTYQWDFGDGGSSTARTPSHKYNTFGKFRVCLKVEDNKCESTFCDTIGLDSSGKLLKAGGFEVIVIEDQLGSVANSKPKTDFKIYPNPANTKVAVDLSNSLVHYTKLQVVDAIGQICFTQAIEIGHEMLDVDLRMINPGLYFIKLSNEQDCSYMKMIKN
jgi:PKD repeat protein